MYHELSGTSGVFSAMSRLKCKHAFMVIVCIKEGLLQSHLYTDMSSPILFKDQVNTQKDVGTQQETSLVPPNKRK